MGLVEHQQLESAAPPLEERKCGVAGGDRDGTDLLLVAIPRTNTLDPERIGELREPLRDEGASRRDDACASAELVDREEGNECLARAGGKHDRPSTPRRAPPIDRLALIVARRARIEERRVELVDRVATLRYPVRQRPAPQLGQTMTGPDERREPVVVRQPGRRVRCGNAAHDGEAELVGQRAGRGQIDLSSAADGSTMIRRTRAGVCAGVR